MSLPVSWRGSAAVIDTELYCAWRKAGCSAMTVGQNAPGSIRSAPGSLVVVSLVIYTLFNCTVSQTQLHLIRHVSCVPGQMCRVQQLHI